MKNLVKNISNKTPCSASKFSTELSFFSISFSPHIRICFTSKCNTRHHFSLYSFRESSYWTFYLKFMLAIFFNSFLFHIFSRNSLLSLNMYFISEAVILTLEYKSLLQTWNSIPNSNSWLCVNFKENMRLLFPLKSICFSSLNIFCISSLFEDCLVNNLKRIFCLNGKKLESLKDLTELLKWPHLMYRSRSTKFVATL